MNQEMQPTQDPSQIGMDPSQQSPETMPMGQSVDQGQPISDQQKQELMKMISAVQDKLSKLNANRFAGSGKLDEAKQKLLQEIFQKLQMAGVDLTDQQSVADFIERLRQRSPELAQMFEEVMGILLGQGGQESAQAPDMANPFENLSGGGGGSEGGLPQSPPDPTTSPMDPTQSPAGIPEQPFPGQQ
jgi:hypothetical protein